MRDLRPNGPVTHMETLQDLASPARGAMVETGVPSEGSIFYYLLCTNCMPDTGSRRKTGECGPRVANTYSRLRLTTCSGRKVARVVPWSRQPHGLGQGGRQQRLRWDKARVCSWDRSGEKPPTMIKRLPKMSLTGLQETTLLGLGLQWRRGQRH